MSAKQPAPCHVAGGKGRTRLTPRSCRRELRLPRRRR
jgi:hypothetical protein